MSLWFRPVNDFQEPTSNLKGLGPLTLKTFTESTGATKPGRFFTDRHFRFTISAQALLARVHRAITGHDVHGAQVEAAAAFIAIFFLYPKGGTDPSILATPHETDGFISMQARTGPHAAPAEYTVAVPEGIANIRHPTTHGQILNGTGVGCLRNKQFGQVVTQSPEFFRIA